MVACLISRMPGQFPPFEPPVPASAAGTSDPPGDNERTQLSSGSGVQSDVSSVAIDRGLLAMASVGPPRGSEGLTDADVMLRVKAGDESAFDYLVQKYRRPMVNFMYRMAHNAAAAEDLAQE